MSLKYRDSKPSPQALFIMDSGGLPDGESALPGRQSWQ